MTNSSFFRIAELAVVVAVSAAICGCGDGRPRRVAVSGQVLIDGEPLPHGNVRFVPEGARPSYGKVDSEGRFSLGCFEPDDGAVVGTHRVQVSASEIIKGKVKWHAPNSYSDYRSSGLVVEIDAPTDDLVIELTWDGQKQGGGK